MFGNKTKRIPCYVLVFDQVEIIDKSLHFLAESSDKLDIHIIENPSENSPAISKIISKLGEQGKIKSHYLFDKNVTNNALLRVLDEQAAVFKRAPYVLLTDGDVVSDDLDWLGEEINILRNNREVFACGITLDLVNLPVTTFPKAKDWIPRDKAEFPDYYENVTGTHLQLTRGKDLYGYLEWIKSTGTKSIDSALHHYCEEVRSMKWARTKKTKAYHLTWDLYQDLNHPYTIMRLQKNHDETWRHDEISDYTLTTFR
jgi:hypothetical protein